MKVSFHIKKAIIELEMAKHEASNSVDRQEIQTVIESILTLKWLLKVK